MGDFLIGLLYVVLAIIILMIMIVIHEFGHYTAGKIFKFKINEFSVGFGKAIFSKTKANGEKFSIRLIPLGGYCAFDGEDETKEDSNSFNNQAWWKRLIVLFSGAFFNFLSAIIFTFILLMVIGSGVVQINEVDNTSPNYGIIQSGDIIYKVDGVTPTFINGGVTKLMEKKNVGENITFEIGRDGNTINVVVQKYSTTVIDSDGNVVLDDENNPVMKDIVGFNSSYVKYSFWSSLINCIPYTFNMAFECLKILGQIFIGQYGLKDLGGPITTISTIANATHINILNLFLLFPLIAVNLAVFNLLPIPALDGARMVFVIIEGIRRKPINREIEGKIHAIGLIVLFAFVILVDILQIFVF